MTGKPGHLEKEKRQSNECKTDYTSRLDCAEEERRKRDLPKKRVQRTTMKTDKRLGGGDSLSRRHSKTKELKGATILEEIYEKEARKKAKSPL